ncbi:MAG TPA: hypothetical protein VNO82_00990 [Solirubrobacteraceae bacterium]|nr:hypothetical protein [Solirubrobacteraceae bacterium]
MKAILISALILAVGVPTVALGAGEGRSLIAGKRNPQGGSLNRETQVISSNSTYSTRQSNLGTGGGAIYGCRAGENAEPCVRANNLKAGHAFEFETGGKTAGDIKVKDATGVPFTTNATGKVANLNADKLDDKEAADFAATSDVLFAAVADGGTLGANRGATASSRAGDATTVTFNRDVSKCSLTATANGTTPQALSVASAGATAPAANQVVVTEDPAAPAVAFHLQVIC